MADDDDVIDFGKWFKKKGSSHPSDDQRVKQSPSSSSASSPDEDTLSWNGIKESFGRLFRRPEKSEASHDDAVDITQTIKKHSSWLIPLLLISIIFVFAFHLRSLSVSVPVADRWAEDYVHSYYRNQITDQVNRQFPNLPAENKASHIDAEFQKLLSENGDLLKGQIRDTAQQFRSQFQDSNGQTYLLGIDPYYYYRQTKNILEYGTVGTEVRDGKPFDSYKLAPLGTFLGATLHPYVGAFVYKVMSIFSGISLMGSFFYVGALISALSVIPAFFIGRKFGGNAGGFFSAWLVAVNVFFVARTAGESSDTDAYVVFFPLLVSWLFLEALDQKNLVACFGLSVLTGAALGLFAFAWTGWWFVFYLILATLGILPVYHAVRAFAAKRGISSEMPRLRRLALILLVVVVSSFVFTTLFTTLDSFTKAFTSPIGFIKIKSVGTEKVWPNVLTTVAELNPSSIPSVIQQIGGMKKSFSNYLVFLLSACGILFTIARKEGRERYATLIFFGLWLAVTLWATTKGVRFTLLVAPAFAIGLGFFCGIAYQYLVSWISSAIKVNRMIASLVVFALLGLLLISPTTLSYEQASRSVPSVNDGWWNALTSIKDSSKPNAIITSWWDFGHWFKAIADRPVTFDGGNQNTPQAHWVGKLLLTPNENVSFGILRMLDCGGNRAFEEINRRVDDIRRSVGIVNDVIVLDSSVAASLLDDYGFSDGEIETILGFTHCQPPEGFVIASDDMIGKSGVWGHFGAWDFTRAAMVFETKKLPREQALDVLQTRFNLSQKDAETTYQQILTEDPNRWIAPWPSYISNSNPCATQNESIVCRIRLQQGEAPLIINTVTMNATMQTREGDAHPNSLTFATSDGVENIEFDGKTTGFSVLLIPQGEGDYVAMLTDPLQAKSMFTQMYFYRGHGLRCFDPFDNRQQITGGLIFTYKADWDCKDKNLVFLKESLKESMANTSLTNISS